MKYSPFTFSASKIPDVSFWQSDFWQKILISSGQATEVFYFGNKESTFFLVEIRSLGAGFFGAFVLGVKKDQIFSDFLEVLSALKKFLRKKGVIFLQIEPIERVNFPESTAKITRKFLTPYTRVIDLNVDTDEILAKMHTKGRYNIRNALRHGIFSEGVTKFDEKILDVWMALVEETTARDNFAHNSRKYYENFWKILEKNLTVMVTKKDDTIISLAMVVVFGETAIYYYGASTSHPDFRKFASSYLMLFESMKIAQQKGAKKYDLLGVADPENPNDSLQGVSQFKERLGGELQKLPEKYIYQLSSKYYAYMFIKKIREVYKKISALFQK